MIPVYLILGVSWLVSMIAAWPDPAALAGFTVAHAVPLTFIVGLDLHIRIRNRTQ